MDKLRAAILTAGFISIVLTVFGTICPAEKFGRQIKLITALVFILCAITPFVNGRINIPEIYSSIGESTEEVYSAEENAMDFFVRRVESSISGSVGEFLSENGISYSEIKTSINISDSGSISINEIEIAVPAPAREDETIALVKNFLDEDTAVKIKETEDEQEGDH